MCGFAFCRFFPDPHIPGDILTKTDRASMAVGVETQAPLLDPKGDGNFSIISFNYAWSSVRTLRTVSSSLSMG